MEGPPRRKDRLLESSSLSLLVFTEVGGFRISDFGFCGGIDSSDYCIQKKLWRISANRCSCLLGVTMQCSIASGPLS